MGILKDFKAKISSVIIQFERKNMKNKISDDCLNDIRVLKEILKNEDFCADELYTTLLEYTNNMWSFWGRMTSSYRYQLYSALKAELTKESEKSLSRKEFRELIDDFQGQKAKIQEQKEELDDYKNKFRIQENILQETDGGKELLEKCRKQEEKLQEYDEKLKMALALQAETAIALCSITKQCQELMNENKLLKNENENFKSQLEQSKDREKEWAEKLRLAEEKIVELSDKKSSRKGNLRRNNKREQKQVPRSRFDF